MTSRTQPDVYPVVGAGNDVQVVSMDYTKPTCFVTVIPMEQVGDEFVPVYDLSGVGGSSKFEIQTSNNPHYVDIQANGSLSAPEDSQFRAPATSMKVTLINPVGFTHYRISVTQLAI